MDMEVQGMMLCSTHTWDLVRALESASPASAEIQKVLQVKSLTEKSNDLKLRLLEKLREQKGKFLLIANHYVSVLPLLKSLVLILRTKNTNIHCIHDLMVDKLSFFSCFVKYESITNLRSNQLKSFDLQPDVRRMK